MRPRKQILRAVFVISLLPSAFWAGGFAWTLFFVAEPPLQVLALDAAAFTLIACFVAFRNGGLRVPSTVRPRALLLKFLPRLAACYAGSVAVVGAAAWGMARWEWLGPAGAEAGFFAADVALWFPVLFAPAPASVLTWRACPRHRRA